MTYANKYKLTCNYDTYEYFDNRICMSHDITIHAGTIIDMYRPYYLDHASACLERSNGESTDTYLWVQ